MQGSNFWSADGTFKAAPDLRTHLYTVHAAAGGYVLPCISALLPNKTGDTYEMAWREIRLQVGGDRDWADMLATVDSAAASIAAIRMAFQTARIGRRYFHLGKSV